MVGQIVHELSNDNRQKDELHKPTHKPSNEEIGQNCQFCQIINNARPLGILKIEINNKSPTRGVIKIVFLRVESHNVKQYHMSDPFS